MSAVVLFLQQETLVDYLGRTGMEKTAAPAENPCSSASSAALAWEMHSHFAVDGCFSGDKGES